MKNLVCVNSTRKAQSNRITDVILCQNMRKSIDLLAFVFLPDRFYLGDEKSI